MARLATPSFEFNTNTTGVDFTATTGSPTISATGARTGTYAGRVSSLTTGAQKYWRYRFSNADSSADTYIRTYLFIASYPNATTTIMGPISSIDNVPGAILLSSTGVMTMTDDSGTVRATSSTLSLNTWYRIEQRYFNTSTTMELKIDGTSIGSSTGATTNVVRDYVWGGNIQGEAATTCDYYFDDMAINNTAAGTGQTSYPGSGKVLRLIPNAAGDANGYLVATGGTAGAANNFTRVNEVTPDDATSNNASVLLNAEDLFNVTDSGIGASDTVNLVAVTGRFADLVAADATTAFKFEIEKTASGTKTQSAAIIANSTTWQTNVAGATQPKVAPITAYLDPDGAAWTQSTLDSMQIGYLLTTAGVRTAAITSVSAIVDYTPAAAPVVAGGSTLLLMGV